MGPAGGRNWSQRKPRPLLGVSGRCWQWLMGDAGLPNTLPNLSVPVRAQTGLLLMPVCLRSLQGHLALYLIPTGVGAWPAERRFSFSWTPPCKHRNVPLIFSRDSPAPQRAFPQVSKPVLIQLGSPGSLPRLLAVLRAGGAALLSMGAVIPWGHDMTSYWPHWLGYEADITSLGSLVLSSFPSSLMA